MRPTTLLPVETAKFETARVEPFEPRLLFAVTPAETRSLQSLANSAAFTLAAGNLLQSRPTTAAFQSLATQLISGSTATTTNLNALAAAQNLSLNTTTLTPTDSRTLARLTSLTGPDFDRAFLQATRQSTTRASALSSRLASSSTADISTFATSQSATLSAQASANQSATADLLTPANVRALQQSAFSNQLILETTNLATTSNLSPAVTSDAAARNALALQSQADLAAFAANRNITLPTIVDRTGQRYLNTLTRFATRSDTAAFSSGYVTLISLTTTSAIRSTTLLAQSPNPALQSFANTSLPTLQTNLSTISTLSAGASPTDPAINPNNPSTGNPTTTPTNPGSPNGGIFGGGGSIFGGGGSIFS